MIKKHRKKIIITALVFSIIILVSVVFRFFPKNVTRLILFSLLFIADYYVWHAFKRWIHRLKRNIRIIISILYWFPAFLLVLVMIKVFFIGYESYVNTKSMYISGFVTMVFFSKFAMSIFVLIADLWRGFRWLFKKIFIKGGFKTGMPKRSKYIELVGLIVSVSMFLLFMYGAVFDVNNFKTNKIIIESNKLPKGFDGFKIVHISDIHFVSWAGQKDFKTIVEKINFLEPDLVVFTGDLVSFMSREAEEFVPMMKEIKAKHGIFAILGNHDYGEYINWESEEAKIKNMAELYSIYIRADWKLLKNEHTYIKINKTDSIALIGVENWSDNKRFATKGDLKKAMNGVNENDYKILLTHDPSHWQAILDSNLNIDLTLSGHTHGMQFGFFGNKVQISPISLIQKRWSGLYKETKNNKEMFLYVNIGLGTVGYTSRVGALPEITLLTLKRKK